MSFELTSGTSISISDDSGFSLDSTNNSSRAEKRTELAESDEFDSLDNCSDGGMSTENFNTMRKVLPPLEFQDSPQTTLMRRSTINYAQRLSNCIIHKAIKELRDEGGSSYQFQHKTNTVIHNKSCDKKLEKKKSNLDTEYIKQKIMSNSQTSIYGSDSFLNNYNKLQNTNSHHHHHHSKMFNDCNSYVETDNENIYDEPNTETEYDFYDVIYKDKRDVVLCTKRIIRSYDKNKKIYADPNDIYYNYQTNFSSNSGGSVRNRGRSTADAAAGDILSNNSFQRKFDNFLKKKFLTTSLNTPTTTTSSILFSPVHHCQHHYYNNSSSTGSNLLSSSNRPNSRNSLNSRLSSSHNSLTVQKANKADDSIFITQAMSHDALLGEISDFYNVPIDSDIYALPVDDVRQQNAKITNLKAKNSISLSDNNLLNSQKTSSKYHSRNKTKLKSRRRKRSDLQQQQHSGQPSHLQQFQYHTGNTRGSNTDHHTQRQLSKPKSKRLSVPENVSQNNQNFTQLSLDEVKKYYNDLYSTSSDTSPVAVPKNNGILNSRNITSIESNISMNDTTSITKFTKNNNQLVVKPKFSVNSKKKQTKEVDSLSSNNNLLKNDSSSHSKFSNASKKSQFSISMNLKQKFCSIFRFKKSHHSRHLAVVQSTEQLKDPILANNDADVHSDNGSEKKINLSTRALPPLPKNDSEKMELDNEDENEDKTEENTMDFAANIEKVKEYGWYWGPLSSEGAEKILSSEPNGSFLVRDSSDDHYIFSLTFKLNGIVRHVRIEQDQGRFSFGSCAKFKSRTIMEFIENAVEHSRSGRYLFFLHRRPEHGPMRVQLTNPVSRFKHVQSLQHLCRFVILKAVVRKDLIVNLPLPRRIIDYLNNKNILSEQIESDSSSQSQVYGENNNSNNTITRM